MCLLDIPQCVLCLSKQFSYKNEQKYENICKLLAAGPSGNGAPLFEWLVCFIAHLLAIHFHVSLTPKILH